MDMGREGKLERLAELKESRLVKKLKECAIRSSEYITLSLVRCINRCMFVYSTTRYFLQFGGVCYRIKCRYVATFSKLHLKYTPNCTIHLGTHIDVLVVWHFLGQGWWTRCGDGGIQKLLTELSQRDCHQLISRRNWKRHWSQNLVETEQYCLMFVIFLAIKDSPMVTLSVSVID